MDSAAKTPLTVTLPGIVTAPLESIVRRVTPTVARPKLPDAGLIKPVPASLANLIAQLEGLPIGKEELVPSALSIGKPPAVIASCITTVFIEVSTVTSPSAPLKV